MDLGKILYVDDDKLLTSTFSTLMKVEGFKNVVTYNNPVEAIEYLKLEAPDLIISDFIVKPISNLTKATNELIKGNYRVRVNYAGEDEISKLYNAFNQMAIQLAKQEETRQQFISDVSHEFQTPLTAISGFANILKSENLPDDQRKKYASIISSNSQRLSTLSKNMLQLTLLEGEDTKLDIHEYSLIDQLNRVIETQDYTALSKDIEIEFIKPVLYDLYEI
jgi:signal transduction histidine kinase